MKRYCILILLILLSLFKSNFGQSSFTEVDTASADYYFKKAKQQLKSNNSDSAIINLKSAADLYKNQNEWSLFVKCYNYLASVVRGKGNFDEAKDYLDSAIVIGTNHLPKNEVQIANSFHILGNILTIKGEYDSAFVSFQNSVSIYTQNDDLDLDTKVNISIVYGNIALNYYYRGDLESSLLYQKKALELQLHLLGENDYDLGVTYHNMAIIFSELGDYDLAIKYDKKAYLIIKDVLGSQHIILASILNGLAEVYRITGQYDLAIEYSQKALDLRIELLGENHYAVERNYKILADTYTQKSNFEKALNYYKKAEKVFLSSLGDKHIELANIYSGISNMYVKMKDFDTALEYADKALTMCLELFGNQHIAVANLYNLIADIYRLKGSYKKALDYYQKSLASNFSGTKQPQNLDSLLFEKALSIKEVVNSLEGKAEVFSRLYNNEKSNLEYLEQSHKNYLLISDLIIKLRFSFKEEGSKLFLAKETYKIYEKAIEVSLELFNKTQKEVYKESAFKFAEKSKANLLLESITESKAKQFSGIPDTLLRREKKLRIDLVYYETEINKEKQKADNRDSVKIQKYESLFFDLNNEYQNLIEKFEKEYPKYYEIKHSTKVLALKDIQNKLNNNDAILLEYFCGDSSLFIFTVGENNIDIYKAKSLQNNIAKKFDNTIYNIDVKDYLETGYELYTQLLKPIEEKIKGKKVILIPDGVLHYLPFEALLSREVQLKNEIDYSQLPYLIKDSELRYSYSAKMALSNLLKYKSKGEKHGGFIGFAPVFRDSGTTTILMNNETGIVDTFNQDIYQKITRKMLTEDGRITPLPSSEEEVKGIYEMFLKNKRPAKIFIDNTASEENLKKLNAEDYKYIHLATHAFINESNSKLSGILFSSAEKEDGVLYTDEMYTLNLEADLVVLSACESGLGEIVRGEGVVGFTSGLIYSGAKNIIVSLWEVGDNSTSKLMQKLYEFILEGKPYSASLREAKLKIIEENKYSPPKYWAPFILVGN